jgi:hypothetical protein
MRPPVFHIGHHKTATSWFQRNVYPQCRSHRFVDRVLVRQAFLCSSAFDFDPAAARAKLGLDSPERPPLVCEEDLSGVLHNGLVSTYVAKEVAERVKAAAPEAAIVIFVRAQPSAIRSSYQQYVREGGTGGPRRYLFPELHRHLGHCRPFKHPHFDLVAFDYRGLIEHYDRLFGRENVHIFAFEQLELDPAGLIAKMRAALDLDFGNARIRTGRVNQAYRRGLLPLARAMNVFTERAVPDKRTILHVPYWYPVRKALLASLNKAPVFGAWPQPEQLFGRRAIRRIEERYWRSNRWLAERMELDLRALGYALDPPQHGPGKDLPRGMSWTRH